MQLVFDIETDGLLDKLTTIHSLVIHDLDTGKVISCVPDYIYNTTETKGSYCRITSGLQLLQQAEVIIGHNIINFDIPAIKKLYPNFRTKGKIFDTLIASKLVFPDIGETDYIKIRRGIYSLPSSLVGKYGLESFGYRLKEYKGTYCKQENAWDKWTPEMQTYCEQDVNLNVKLYHRIIKEKIPKKALWIEQRFQEIIDLQIRYGVLFDTDKAMKIVGILKQKEFDLNEKLQELFPPETKVTTFIPKVNNKTRGYVKGVPFKKKTIIPFNPNSSQNIADRLIGKYGWKPTVVTPTELPKVSEEVLETLKYPEIPTLLEYLKVTNALSKIYSGDGSWLSCISKDGRVRGLVNPFGTGTRRCSHSKPNTTQLPKNSYLSYIKPRECVKPRDGYVLVGADASGLELRCLAHYMNDPDYTNEILTGDIHTKNQLAAGLPTRDNAKTFIYGFLYGAGNEKIGSIIGGGSKEGKKIKEKFLAGIPSLGRLTKQVKEKAKKQGYLTSIDGAKVRIKKEYTALNYLLQGCGAILMKTALIILYDDLTELGWKFGEDYAFVLNCHDEVQAEVKPELVSVYKQTAINALRKSGEYFNFRCPLDGEAKEGLNWAETH